MKRTSLGHGGLDFLFGQRGNDTLNGDDGPDRLWGGSEDDLLNGGSRPDWLWEMEAPTSGSMTKEGTTASSPLPTGRLTRSTADDRDRAVLRPGDTAVDCERVRFLGP